MNVSSVYNQIRMYSQDEAHIAFYGDNNIFYYKFIPFRLVNVREPIKGLLT